MKLIKLQYLGITGMRSMEFRFILQLKMTLSDSLLSGVYKHQKSEHFDEYLTAMGKTKLKLAFYWQR